MVRVRQVGIAVAGFKGDQDECWSRLRRAWFEATGLANWSVQQLAAADIIRTADMEKIPGYRFAKAEEPQPRRGAVKRDGDGKVVLPYLFGRWNADYQPRAFWKGAAQSANCIFQMAQRKWVSERWGILWQRKRRPAEFRSLPFPIHQQSWRLELDDKDGRYYVSFPLPGGPRIVARLRMGPEYRYQIGELKKHLQGQSKAGELRLCYDERNKLCILRFALIYPDAALAVAKAREATQVLLVRSDPCALLVAELPGRARPWIINGDHLGRKILEHRVLRQRLSEDMKREKRLPPEKKRGMLKALRDRCAKFDRWMDTEIHTLSAQVVGFAQRQRVQEILWDDPDEGYLAGFRWADLRGKVGYKCEDVGIVFTWTKGHCGTDVQKPKRSRKGA